MAKDWQDLRNKEQDDFFRNHLEKSDFPFMEGDWEKMSSKLDNIHSNNQGNVIRRNKGGIILGGFIILMTAIVFFNNLNSGIQKDNDYLLTKIQLEEESNMNFLDENIYSKTSVIQNNIQPERSTNSKDVQNIFFQDEVIIVNQHRILKLSPDLPSSNHISTNKNIQNLNFEFNRSFQDELIGQISISNSLNTIADIPNSLEKEKNKPDKLGSKFAIALLYSPDVSALNVKEIRGVGSSAGLNLEYYIKRKLSVNLGMIYSFKTYQTHEGYGGIYSPHTISVSGECFIFDIPINLRYYAINSELDRWYISSGLSSYLMLTEKYKIDHGSNNPTEPSQIRVDRENNHLFNIMNFSFGYERKLADQWALQVEPFVRIPLSGIGERNVNLKSSGVWIGIKHTW